MSNNKKKDKKNEPKDSRQSSLKLYSIGTVVILLVIVLVANILIENVLGKHMSFDFSLAGQNSVSQTTIDFLESLPADSNIRIVGLMDRPENLNNSPHPPLLSLPLFAFFLRRSRSGQAISEKRALRGYPRRSGACRSRR